LAGTLPGGEWSAHPSGVDSSLGRVVRRVNDRTSDRGRGRLLGLAPWLIGQRIPGGLAVPRRAADEALYAFLVQTLDAVRVAEGLLPLALAMDEVACPPTLPVFARLHVAAEETWLECRADLDGWPEPLVRGWWRRRDELADHGPL
jgi:hypothetical protein